MQLKDMPVQVKAGPDDGLAEGQFSAYASVFGNVDSYGDVVAKGAFAKDLERWQESGNPIPLLFGHNMSDPDYNLGHVVSATEDEKGLLVTAQLDLENPKAMQTYRMLKGRRINQMSFAYDVLDEDTVEVASGVKANELRDLKLYEVSVVTIGANQDTEVLAVKTGATALESAMKAGRVLSAKNETSLREARDAIDAVLSSLGSTDDQEKASGDAEVKSDASDEEPPAAKSSVSDEEPKSSPSVDAVLAVISISERN
jgi:HK97 family phage prohead protease